MDFLEPLLSADDAEKADRHTINVRGVSASELMERAGLAIAHKVEALLLQHKMLPAIPVVVVCGPGNNGGDGFVVARRLWQNGCRTAVLALVPPEQLKNEASIAAQHFMAAALNEGWALTDLSSSLTHVSSGEALFNVLAKLRPAIVVDAIFGTGLKRPPEGVFAEAIQALNFFRRQNEDTHVLAVDIPSGLYCDGQRSSLDHVRADSTVAIQFRKISHLSGPHWLSCGDVSTVDIGLILAQTPAAHVLLSGAQPALALLNAPKRLAHKGDFGHVGVLYGSAGMQGASQLSAYAALRAGAGLATLLLPEGSALTSKLPPEIMHRELHSPLDEKAFARISAFVAGPGLDQHLLGIALELINYAASRNLPVVVDAGALPLLHKILAPAKIVATPHPGEAARLLGTSAAAIEDDRIKAAHDLLTLSKDWAAEVTWVLKGACPIVASATASLVVCEGGITTLSVGGSGDVLAGTCAALFAQSDSPFAAALLAVSAHLEAGRRLETLQQRGFLAHEIGDEIAKVLFGSCPPQGIFNRV